MYDNLLGQLNEIPFFTPVTVMQLMEKSDRVVLQWLARQVKKGKILRIKRGRYMAREYYLSHKHEAGFVASLAHVIEPNSYLSGAWVLQKNEMLSESVYKVTSMTSKHAKEVQNEVGSFVFTQIKPRLFTGYEKVWCGGSWGYEARRAKALFDYCYDRKVPTALTEERLNLEDWGETERNEFEDYAKLAGSAKMARWGQILREAK